MKLRHLVEPLSDPANSIRGLLDELGSQELLLQMGNPEAAPEHKEAIEAVRTEIYLRFDRMKKQIVALTKERDGLIAQCDNLRNRLAEAESDS